VVGRNDVLNFVKQAEINMKKTRFFAAKCGIYILTNVMVCCVMCLFVLCAFVCSQQDAQEFLISLLEGLQDDLNRVRDKNKKRHIDCSSEVETIRQDSLSCCFASGYFCIVSVGLVCFKK